MLLKREGCRRNRRRVQRLYREEGLSVRKRRAAEDGIRRQISDGDSAWTQRAVEHRCVRGTLADGRVFRGFTAADDFTREYPEL